MWRVRGGVSAPYPGLNTLEGVIKMIKGYALEGPDGNVHLLAGRTNEFACTKEQAIDTLVAYNPMELGLTNEPFSTWKAYKDAGWKVIHISIVKTCVA